MMAAKKFSQTEAHLDGVEAGVVRGQTGVRDVHVAEFHAPVISVTKEVRPHGGRWSEIHVVSSGWHIVIRDQKSAAQFGVWNHAAASGKIPFQCERIESRTESGVGGLEHQERGNNIDGIFEAAFQKSGAVGSGKDPTVAETDVPHTGIGCSARYAMAATGPDL